MPGIALGLVMNRMKMKTEQTGFTLLEALIGFLILSIGLLGIASLHTLSLQSGKTSIYKTVAMEKAQQIMESIRANATELQPSNGQPSAYIAGFGATGTVCLNACSTSQMALDDIYHWKRDLKVGLPNTTDTKASIAVTPAVGSSKLHTVTVTVNWKERSNKSETGVTRSYVLQADICSEQPC